MVAPETSCVFPISGFIALASFWTHREERQVLRLRDEADQVAVECKYHSCAVGDALTDVRDGGLDESSQLFEDLSPVR